MNDDQTYMRRCFQLAELGLGRVSPNPLVGAVLVCRGKIVSEGYHRLYGGPHAEVNALQAIADADVLRHSTLYVNLEPCSHYGKTPPCADLILEKNIPEVVVCNVDPNPKVAGRGLEKLRQGGVIVRQGILEEEGRLLNRRFFTAQEKKRPYIVLKWAQTADGYLAHSDPKQGLWISNDYFRTLVHKWRSEEDAIFVGTRTAAYDNPRLNVRHYFGKNPLRLVSDRHQSLPNSLHLFDGSQDTKVLTGKNVHEILAEMHAIGLQSVIIEGGATLLQAFIDEKLWDEARIICSPLPLGQGLKAPSLPQGASHSYCAEGQLLRQIYKPQDV